MSGYYEFDEHDYWEKEQIRQLGLDDESQNADNPEWWVENGDWGND